jgi:alpha-tubulin suppressor-like RCC1 family protein
MIANSMSKTVHTQATLATSASLATWGENSTGELADGQLGNGTQLQWSTPGTFPNFFSASASQIVGGGGHFLALLPDVAGKPEVIAWGRNDSGQLGNNATKPPLDSPSPVTVASSFNGSGTLQSVAAGFQFSLALDGQGDVWAWGDNQWGQIGQGKLDQTSYHTLPVEVTTSTGTVLTNIKMIAAGAFHALAVDGSGNVWAWGKNDIGQLGLGNSSPGPELCPVNKPAIPCSTSAMELGNVCLGYDSQAAPQQVTAGTQHSIVLCHSQTGDTFLIGWGDNRTAQLEFGRDPCTTLGFGLTTQVVAGGYHNLAVCETSMEATVISWGANNDGQLGIGNIASASDPAQVLVQQAPGVLVPLATPDVTDPIHLAAGYQHSLAIVPGVPGVSGGPVYAWGSDSAGQLAQPPGTMRNDYAIPVTLTGITPTGIAATSNSSAITY